jgi:hypothetical protein
MMAEKIASLYAEITADTSKLKRGLDDSKKGLASLKGGVGDAIQGLTGLSVSAIGTGALFTALGTAIGFSVSEAVEAQKINAQLEQVIKSTGGAAGLAAGEIDRMAGEMQNLTTVDDDTVKKASAVMLTFTKIGKDVFPEATMAALDMSAALGTELQGSVIQIGKALNDPIRGVTALQKVGVSFTEQQRDQIKVLVESGKTLEAQKLILAELNTEFGGQAAAAAGTYAGKLEQLKNSAANLAEEVGGHLVPALTNVVDVMNLALTWNDKLSNAYSDHESEVRKTAKSYDEYYAEVLRAAKASGLFDQTINLTSDELAQMGVTTDYVAEEIGALTKEQFDGIRAAEGWGNGQREAAIATQYAGNTAATAAIDVESLNTAYNELKTVIGGEFGNEIENFNSKMGDLRLTQKSLVKEIEELESKNYLTREQKERLEELRGDLWKTGDQMRVLADQHEEAMKRMAFNMLMERAASDGLTENEVKNLTTIGKAWGLYDEKTAAVINSINENIAELDTSNPNNLLDILRNILGLPSTKSFNFEVNWTQNGSVPAALGDVGLVDNGTINPVPNTDTGDNYDGRRALGGHVGSGGVYWTGEGGPEPFIPDRPGRILSRQDAMTALAQASGSGGGLNINGPITVVANDPQAFISQLQAMGRRARLAQISGVQYQGG